MSTLTAARIALQQRNTQPNTPVVSSAGVFIPFQPTNNTPWAAINTNVQAMGKQLQAARLAKKWTQRQLAQATGISQGTVTRMEKHGWVSLHMMFRMAHSLGKQITLN